VLCSRYVEGHAAAHAEANKDHCISVSFADCSCWCYKCDAYLEDPVSTKFVRLVQQAKFGTAPKAGTIGEAVAAAEGFTLHEDMIIEGRSGERIVVRNVMPGQSVQVINCSKCVIEVQMQLPKLRVTGCRNCTLQVNKSVLYLDIEKCAALTVRQFVNASKSSANVKDSAAIFVLEPVKEVHYIFYSSFIAEQSVIGISNGTVEEYITSRPRTKTTFNAEKNAFETVDCPL